MAQNNNNAAHRAYSNAEYINMYKCFIRQDEKFPRAAEEYARLYPDIRHPDYRVIRNVVNSMNETGCINPYSQERQFFDNTPVELVNLIIRSFEEDPNLSLRICALRLEVPHTLIHSILIGNHWYPYHYRKVQILNGENDYAARLFVGV